jgi:hypothetical protein
MTQELTTNRGVKYRGAKKTLTFKKYAQCYGDVANIGALNNNFYLNVGTGATLTAGNDVVGTDIPINVTYNIQGTLNDSVAGGPFSNLASIEGALYLENGQTTNITPVGGTLAINGYPYSSYYCQYYSYAYGCLDVGNASTLNINGNVTNTGFLSTGIHGSSGNTLNITGSLDNSGTFYENAGGDVANINGVANEAYATFHVDNNSTANLGQFNNYGYVYVGYGGVINTSNQITDIPNTGGIQLYGNINNGTGDAQQ